MSYLDLARRLRESEPGEPGSRLDPADCLELLLEMHASNRADYVPGALSLLDTDPSLRQRFDITEARIDELAKVSSGPSEVDFRRALAQHAAVWRELMARQRARQERQADPMPELPDDTALAIGVSYGDGEPGTWDVIREGRRR
jgi:hypothetical protein